MKEFASERTVTKYVDWTGRATEIVATIVDYRLPEANSTMIQGGASYAPPGKSGVKRGLWPDGIRIRFSESYRWSTCPRVGGRTCRIYEQRSMVCNQIQSTCPDYSPTGCPGFYLGNQVIIQHADGTYSAFSHLQTNSIQVAVGTSVCQGLCRPAGPYRLDQRFVQ